MATRARQRRSVPQRTPTSADDGNAEVGCFCGFGRARSVRTLSASGAAGGLPLPAPDFAAGGGAIVARTAAPRATRVASEANFDIVIKQGYLVKQGAVVRNWKRRYFVLTGVSLTYYASDESDGPCGTIALADVTGVRVGSLPNHMFDVRTEQRDFRMMAESDVGRMEWLKAIAKALTRPSDASRLLQRASEYARDGKVSAATRDEVAGLLAEGTDEGAVRAQQVLDAAFPPDTPEPAEAVALLLHQLGTVTRPQSIVNVLTRLRAVVAKVDCHPSVDSRITNICVAQQAVLDGRWTDEAAALLQSVLRRTVRRRKGGTEGDAWGARGVKGGRGGSRGSLTRRDTSKEALRQRVVTVTIDGCHSGEGGSPEATRPIATATGGADAAGVAGYGSDVDPASLEQLVRQMNAAARSPGCFFAKELSSVPEAVVGSYPACDSEAQIETHGAAGAAGSGLALSEEPDRERSERGLDIEAGEGLTRDADADESELTVSEVGELTEREDSSLDALAEVELNVPKFRQSDSFDEDFELGEHVGAGAYSTVHRATHRVLGLEMAVKVVTKARLDSRELALLHQEVDVMRRLKHPNIVHLEAFYEDADSFYIVTELCTGGELFDQIVKRHHYSETEARTIVRTLAKALRYCHANGIAHRDVKPENILLATPDPRTAVIKLVDLGFARPVTERGMATSCGTPSYVAPEVLKASASRRYGTPVDCWSLGVITYVLLAGYQPFEATTQANLFRLILKGRFVFDAPYWDNVSEEAMDLIRHLLVVNPAERFTAEQVLAHPWVSGASRSGSSSLGMVLAQMRLFNSRRRRTITRGYLEKRGRIVRAFRRRFFCLTCVDLQYYDDEGSSVPKGVIELCNVTRVGSERDEDGRETNIVLVTRTGRSFVLRATTETLSRTWRQLITTTIQQLDLMTKAHTAYRVKELDNAKALITMAKQWERMRDVKAADAVASPQQSRGDGGATAAATRDGRATAPIAIPVSGSAAPAKATAAGAGWGSSEHAPASASAPARV